MKAVGEDGTVMGSMLPSLLKSEDGHFREAAKAGGLVPIRVTQSVPPGEVWVVLAPATGHERLLSQGSGGADTQVWTML